MNNGMLEALESDGIRLAATVMLVRDTDAGLEVYMVKRTGRGAFPDLHVFPGGKVDEADYAPEIFTDMEDGQASETLGITAGGLRYWVAVARECFEECGVLLAQRDGAFLDFSQPDTVERFADFRQRLLAGELHFNALCEAEGLKIAADQLAYFSHWITPEMAPRRFNTRFFVAAMREDQQTLPHLAEAADDAWVLPQDALSHGEDGDWQMIDPTVRSLQTLSQYSCVSDALAGIRSGDHLMPLTPELNAQGMQPLR
ncbi:MAG: NUDIX hydrolase [Pseudomonadota bacterium]